MKIGDLVTRDDDVDYPVAAYRDMYSKSIGFIDHGELCIYLGEAWSVVTRVTGYFLTARYGVVMSNSSKFHVTLRRRSSNSQLEQWYWGL